jgi:DNA-binding response OmpR family regulator
MSYVLVVEPDAAIREFITLALTDEGYEVNAADNVTTAVELFTSRRPGAILVDIRLPVSEGQGLLRCIQRIEPGVSCIGVMSTVPNIEKILAEIDVNFCLVKPFDLGTLLACLNTCTGQ